MVHVKHKVGSSKKKALHPVTRESQCHYEREELTIRSIRTCYLLRCLRLPVCTATLIGNRVDPADMRVRDMQIVPKYITQQK